MELKKIQKKSKKIWIIKFFLYICDVKQKQTLMEKKVFIVTRRTEKGFEYFGIFTTEELAELEAKIHYGAYIAVIKINQPTMF